MYMAAARSASRSMACSSSSSSVRLPTGEIVLARAVVTLGLSYAMVRRAELSPWGNDAQARRARPARLRRARLLLHGARAPAARRRDDAPVHDSARHGTARVVAARRAHRLGAAFAIACGIAGVLLVVHPGVRPTRRCRRRRPSRSHGDVLVVRVRHRPPARADRARARHRVLLSARRDAARDPVGGRDFVWPSATDGCCSSRSA